MNIHNFHACSLDGSERGGVPHRTNNKRGRSRESPVIALETLLILRPTLQRRSSDLRRRGRTRDWKSYHFSNECFPASSAPSRFPIRLSCHIFRSFKYVLYAVRGCRCFTFSQLPFFYRPPATTQGRAKRRSAHAQGWVMKNGKWNCTVQGPDRRGAIKM